MAAITHLGSALKEHSAGRGEIQQIINKAQKQEIRWGRHRKERSGGKMRKKEGLQEL